MSPSGSLSTHAFEPVSDPPGASGYPCCAGALPFGLRWVLDGLSVSVLYPCPVRGQDPWNRLTRP